jgi:hypothetical protein
LNDFHTDGSTYHFRIKATDGVDTWYGDDRQFAVLLVMGLDPYVIDNEMTDGTLTDVVVLKDVLMLETGHIMLESPEVLGIAITGGSRTSFYDNTAEVSGVAITGGTIT